MASRQSAELMRWNFARDNTRLYFTGVFDRLAAGWAASRADVFMPQAWLAAQQKPGQADSEIASIG